MTNLKYPYRSKNPVFLCAYPETYYDSRTDRIEHGYAYINIRAYDRDEAKRICKLLTGAQIKSIVIECKQGWGYKAENDKDDIRARLYGEGC